MKLSELNKNELLLLCKKLLHKKFNEHWLAERSRIIATGGKLEFLVRFKKLFAREQYLQLITIPKFRRSLTKFRISAHNLPVETGRYKGLDRKDRICPHCNHGIGDEVHYMFMCDNPLIVKLRTSLFSNIARIRPEFPNLQQDDKLIFLMQCTNGDILQLLASFLFKLEEIFKDTIV